MGLRPNEYFLGKIQQVYETMKVRHGFMLIGNPMGGKTMALTALANALSFIAEKVSPLFCMDGIFNRFLSLLII